VQGTAHGLLAQVTQKFDATVADRRAVVEEGGRRQSGTQCRLVAEEADAIGRARCAQPTKFSRRGRSIASSGLVSEERQWTRTTRPAPLSRSVRRVLAPR
jgi:hypothetical protein